MHRSRILIAEDEAGTSLILRRRLEEFGFNPVAVAATAEAAVDLATQLRPNLVLMDVHLAHNTDGIRAAEDIWRQLEIPTIFLTGSLDDRVLMRAKAAKPFGFLAKPFNGHELRAAVEGALHRHDAEMRLQGSQDQLDGFRQTTTDGFLIAAADGRILEINAEGTRLTGRAEGDTLGAGLFQLEGGSSPADFATILAQLRKSGSLRSEGRLHQLPGGWVDVDANFWLSPQTQRLFGIFHDISARRQAHHRLRQLSRAVEQCPVTIVITDINGTIEYVNPRFVETTGYSAAEAMGQNPRVLKSGAQPPEFYQALWTTIRAGRVWSGEFRNRRKNGELYWERATISPVRDNDGAVSHFIAIKEDITEDREIAARLSLRESYLSAMIENQPGPAWFKDLSGRFLLVNRAYARLCGRSDPAELVGQTDAEVWPAERAEFNQAMDREVIRSGNLHTYEEEIWVDGTQRWFECIKTVVRDPAGQPVATTGYDHEVTARKRAALDLMQSQDELRHANEQLHVAVRREQELAAAAEAASRAKSLFLANMSHELRTPLNVINGLAAVLAAEGGDSSAARSAQLILQSGQSLLGIIGDILDYTSFQVGRARLAVRSFALPEAVFSALRAVADPAQGKPLTLSCWLSPALPAILEGDARRLEQVLVVFLQNAVKFTAGGRVHLSVSGRRAAAGEWRLVFRIFDSGIGIAAADIGRLFQPFCQASKTVAEHFGGTGLGLAIAKSFAELMGGDVSVRSRPGVGSVFRCAVMIPGGPGQSIFHVGAPTGLRGRKGAIWIADARHRRLVVAILQAWEIPVAVCASQIALIAAGAQADFIILDTADANAASPAVRHWATGRPVPTLWLAHGPVRRPDLAGHSATIALPPSPAELAKALHDLLIVEATTASGAPVPPQPATLAARLPLRILAADDARTNREVLRLILGHLGYRVMLVENGAEVLRALERQTFDLVLLDVRMPVMDGIAAAQEIVRRWPDATRRPKLVAVTANALPEDRENCLAAGMDDYLSKPVLPHDLERCLTRVFPTAGRPAAAETRLADEAAQPPLVDAAHLAALLPGIPGAQAAALLRQMHDAAKHDYQTARDGLAAACGCQDHARFADVVHGLKGCFKMLGWARAGNYCAEALTLARRGAFANWSAFPGELDRLYALSGSAMEQHLAALAAAGGTEKP